MKTFYLFIFGVTLCCILSCKKDEEVQINPWAENIKLIPPGSDFYLVADVEGIPGVEKIIYPSPNDNGASDFASAICNVDECHTLLVIGDPNKTNDFWFVIILQKKGPNGFDNLIRDGQYNYSTPSNRANGTLISFTLEKYGEFRTDYFDNNKIEDSNFELKQVNDLFGNQFLESKFNCKLQTNKGHTIILKNAVWKINI